MRHRNVSEIFIKKNKVPPHLYKFFSSCIFVPLRLLETKSTKHSCLPVCSHCQGTKYCYLVTSLDSLQCRSHLHYINFYFMWMTPEFFSTVSEFDSNPWVSFFFSLKNVLLCILIFSVDVFTQAETLFEAQCSPIYTDRLLSCSALA